MAINTKINNLETVKEQKTDVQLQSEQFKAAKNISQGKRSKFKCSTMYAPLYPNGFLSTYQGLIINLIFDNREVELPDVIIDYIKDKIQQKADKEAIKTYRFENQVTDKIEM